MGNYQLSDTVYGDCEESMEVGVSAGIGIFSAGNYEFPNINEGKQAWDTSEEKGWSMSRIDHNRMIYSGETRMKSSHTKIEEKTVMKTIDSRTFEI